MLGGRGGRERRGGKGDGRIGRSWKIWVSYLYVIPIAFLSSSGVSLSDKGTRILKRRSGPYLIRKLREVWVLGLRLSTAGCSGHGEVLEARSPKGRQSRPFSLSSLSSPKNSTHFSGPEQPAEIRLCTFMGRGRG